MKDKLKEYGLKVRESDNPDREPIDFLIYDEDDNVCWVWGETPDNVDWECNHPIVEFDDDEPAGECLLCGSHCDCHYEADIGNVEDYAWSGRRLVPHEWHTGTQIGGLVREYLEELKGK